MEIAVSFAHVSIVVRELCRSVDFYCHVLGAKIIEIIEPAGNPVKLVLLKIGGQQIELLQYLDNRTQEDRKSGRIDHLAFYVENIDQAVELLRRNNVPCIDPEPRQFGEKRIFFFSGPDGERIEFVQERGV